MNKRRDGSNTILSSSSLLLKWLLVIMSSCLLHQSTVNGFVITKPTTAVSTTVSTPTTQVGRNYCKRNSCILTSQSQAQQHRMSYPIVLYGSYRDDDNHRDEDEDDDDEDVRTNVENLLTQRSIQSFMFLCESCRDPHSIKWLEEFLDIPNLLMYHGTGSGWNIEKFNKTNDSKKWYTPLVEMINQPKTRFIIQAKRRGRGHGGWSKNNPYLQERFVEYPIDIDPVNLCSRILSVREQIATEWVCDLDILYIANNQILDSYYEQMKDIRDDESKSGSDIDDGDTPTPTLVAAASFERTANTIFNNQKGFIDSETEFSSSPLRKGSFDLLYTLCTQRSIHRILRKYQRNKNKVLFDWFLNYYQARVAKYFDGDQRNGRADDFIEELLQTSPTLIKDSIDIIDPLKIAEDIIETRNTIIKEWKLIMEDVPNAHSYYVRKALLNKQIGGNSDDADADINTPSTTAADDDGVTPPPTGSFQ